MRVLFVFGVCEGDGVGHKGVKGREPVLVGYICEILYIKVAIIEDKNCKKF